MYNIINKLELVFTFLIILYLAIFLTLKAIKIVKHEGKENSKEVLKEELVTISLGVILFIWFGIDFANTLR